MAIPRNPIPTPNTTATPLAGWIKRNMTMKLIRSISELAKSS